MIRLRTFGGVVLVRDGKPLEGPPAQRRRLALLALLAVSDERGMSRDRLHALLWEESDADHARHNLSQLLHILHRDLGPDPCVTGGAELRLNPAVIASDVQEFSAALAKGDTGRLAALHAGPFLEGFHLDGAPEFERWVDRERTRLSWEFATSLEAIAREAESSGNHERAVTVWRRLLAENPLNGRVTVLLMNALAIAGDRVGALKMAEVHQELIQRELGTEPDRAVTDLALRIRNRSMG